MTSRRKTHLVIACVLLLLSVSLFVGVLFWANNLDHNKIIYRDTDEKSYTYIKHTQRTGKNACYLIYVAEEEKPLLISSVAMRKVNSTPLSDLQSGESLTCYVIDSERDSFAYKIAEIKSEHGVILSLENYNAAQLSNQKVGCIAAAVFSAIFLLLGSLFLVKYVNPKRLFWLFGYT